MTLIVIGKTGQVATELARHAPTAICLGREEAELSEPEAAGAALEARLSAGATTAIINAAAYTAVDRAETEESLAAQVNSVAPGVLARVAARHGVPFVHISTDYVFSGTGTRAWRPGDEAAPLGAYGRTKHAGEEAVRAAGGPHTILRTSWVVSAHGANFVKTMLRLGAERAELNVVADQVGGPTGAAEIAWACIKIAEALSRDPSRSGTYHFAGAPDVSWAAFAREIFAQTGLPCDVKEIPSRDYPTPAPRPLNSRLDCSATEAAFGIKRPDWRRSLANILRELGVDQAMGSSR
ncbi:MAG: dTDP-4-dehydrorhamnose reductase [Pseudomonadota bacterium]